MQEHLCYIATCTHYRNPAIVQSPLLISSGMVTHSALNSCNSIHMAQITHASGTFQGVSVFRTRLRTSLVIRVTYVHQSGSSGSNVIGTTSRTRRGSSLSC